jgi:polysaccharide deacetylase family protein (PEP-CTERM system associated)
MSLNILSIDLEDYYMVTALSRVVKREDWHLYESRVGLTTQRLLEILEGNHGPSNNGSSGGNDGGARPVRATFFCLGWIAERNPQLIKLIRAQGHEIASHGYDHRLITSMTREEFREDIRKSKAILEDLTGERVLGYRAPSYSVTKKTLWALEILAEEGFLYDSSIFPVHHDRYGIPDAPRLPCVVSICGNRGVTFGPMTWSCLNQPATADTLRLLEFPMATLNLAGQNLPVAGGGYFRLFPAWFTQWALNRIEHGAEAPFVFYLHPWEIDPDQPRIQGLSYRSRFRHYFNLARTESRFKELLRVKGFCSFRDFLEQPK